METSLEISAGLPTSNELHQCVRQVVFINRIFSTNLAQIRVNSEKRSFTFNESDVSICKQKNRNPISNHGISAFMKNPNSSGVTIVGLVLPPLRWRHHDIDNCANDIWIVTKSGHSRVGFIAHNYFKMKLQLQQVIVREKLVIVNK